MGSLMETTMKYHQYCMLKRMEEMKQETPIEVEMNDLKYDPSLCVSSIICEAFGCMLIKWNEHYTCCKKISNWSIYKNIITI